VAVAERRGVHYAWVVAATTFVTLLAAAGFRAAPGVLIEPLEQDFGWSRGTISAAISVNLVLFGLIGPFAAALMGRFGLQRVVVVALVSVSTGAALTTVMDSSWQLIVLWGVVVGAGSGCMATVLAATVAARWFVARRGLVTGALTAATATGQLVFLPVLAYLAEDVGWRWVSVSIALSAVAVIPLVLLLLRDRPEDVGLTPLGAPLDHEPPPTIAHPVAAAFEGLSAVRRHGAFWLLAGSFFVCGASTNGLIGTHFIPAAHDHGITETRAAGLLALIGIFDVIGTLGSGWLTDRMDPRRLLFAYYSLRGLSLLVLDQAFDTHRIGLLGFMVFYGLDWVATVPPTVALCHQCFGRSRGTVVYGWVFAAHQIGAALVAWFAGASHGWTGSYRISFVIAGGLCLLAAVATQRIEPPGRGVTPADEGSASGGPAERGPERGPVPAPVPA
jgi:sugar phosphate permease